LPVEAAPPVTGLADAVPTLPEDATEQTVVLGQPEPAPQPKKTYTAKRPSKQIITNDIGTKPAPSTETASDGTGALSPIGQLSAGDSSDNPALRQETTELIASTEKRFKTVDSNIAANKHDTIVQIASFLKQAKQAMAINDLQGANTLATKAKILVDELLK
jgi:hypothetical protein